MFKNKKVWMIIGIIAVIGAAAFGAWQLWLKPEPETVTETIMETGTVTLGDLSITASGSGQLLASQETALGGSTSGVLEELLVEVGDHVNEGDVLGWIDDTQAQSNLATAEQTLLEAEINNKIALKQAELALSEAEANFATAEEALDELVNWEPDEEELEKAKANLASAQVSYSNAVAKANMYDEQITSVSISLDQAVRNLESAQETYNNAMDPARDWEKNIEDTRESAYSALVKAQENLQIAQASYNLNTLNDSTSSVSSAYVSLISAQEAVAELETEPEDDEIAAAEIAVLEAEIALTQAQLDLKENEDGIPAALRTAEVALEQAQADYDVAAEALADTTLTAPYDGVITDVNYDVGDTVNGTVLVIQDLDEPVIQFWVEEMDMQNVAVGNRIEIVFDALPDYTYEGEITSVEPVLVTVSNTSAVQVWASINTKAYPVTLLGNMNADIEIVAGETTNAMLVPVQALREVDTDQYAVFVVLDNGDLEMRFVEVGLMDYVNAEILSGVEVGETISLGETTSSTSSSSTTATTEVAAPGGGNMMMIPGGGRP